MDKNFKSETAVRDKMIAGLEKEIKIQAELIMEQKTMIKTLQEHNCELQKMIERILKT